MYQCLVKARDSRSDEVILFRFASGFDPANRAISSVKRTAAIIADVDKIVSAATIAGAVIVFCNRTAVVAFFHSTLC